MISNEQMAQMFAYMENIRNHVNNPRYRSPSNINFGEERFGEIPGEERTTYVNKYADIKTLSDKITSQLYSGESKYGDEIKGVYVDIITARRKILKKNGIKGKNKRGMLCACIIIVLAAYGLNINVNKLVVAANKVDTGTVKTTSKMIFRYLEEVSELLPQLLNNDVYKALEKEVRIFSIELNHSRQERAQLLKTVHKIDKKLLSQHTPHIIAAAILFHHEKGFLKSTKDQKFLIKKLKVSEKTLLNVFKKMFPNISSIPKL